MGGALRYCIVLININKTENENGCDAVYWWCNIMLNSKMQTSLQWDMEKPHDNDCGAVKFNVNENKKCPKYTSEVLGVKLGVDTSKRCLRVSVNCFIKTLAQNL